MSKAIAVISVGMNNTKALGAPASFVSTVNDFSGKMQSLIADAATLVDQVICVGFVSVDDRVQADTIK